MSRAHDRRLPAWRMALVGRALGLGLLGLAAGCGGAAAQPTATPSVVARMLVGKWVVKAGHLAKLEITLGDEVQFGADGRYTWGKQEGSYSVFRDEIVTIHSTYGEKFEYRLIVARDVLTMSRGTDCGKEDLYVLERER